MKHPNPTTTPSTTRSTKRALSPALRLTLGLATLLTLAFAAFSAYAMRAEPTMRAEDSTYESRSIALQVRPSEVAARTLESSVDPGATEAAAYMPRARALGRSL